MASEPKTRLSNWQAAAGDGAALAAGDGLSARLEVWLDRPLLGWLTWERALYVALVVIALLTRFYELGARVMSHDESLHTYFSYQLAVGRGFQHTPLMHGPFLFHVTALSYFLFGADDFTSRLPMAVAGVILVALPYALRRELGRAGALIAAALLLISPSILYHARYIRQEQTILVWTFLSVLFSWRFLQDRRPAWLLALAGVLGFHATDKSTSFLVVAQLFLFFAPVALWQLWRARGQRRDALALVALGGFTAVWMVGLSISFEFVNNALAQLGLERPGQGALSLSALGFVAVLVALTAAVSLALTWLYRALFGDWMRRTAPDAPALSVVMVLVTTTMFMASPSMLLIKNRLWELFRGEELVPISALGDMASLQANPQVIGTMLAMTLALIAVAIALGMVWQPQLWVRMIAIFLSITITLFTTVFTNLTGGLATGFVGQLGYWMAQQPVMRGSQPWYYYLLIAPMYEYLSFAGALAALVVLGMSLARRLRARPVADLNAPNDTSPLADWLRAQGFPVLLAWWAVSAWITYTIAGEKMPWLTVHLALPMCLLTAWLAGQAVESVQRGWINAPAAQRWLAVGAAVVLVLLMVRGLSLIGGLDWDGWLAGERARWIAEAAVTAALLAGAWVALRRLAGQIAPILSGLAALGLLAVLTVRTAVTVTYINYDYTKEFLFYAHGAPGVKIALRQLEDLARRMGGDQPLRIAYTQSTSWPFTWYMIRFPGARFVGSSLPADYETFHAVLASEQDAQYAQIAEQLSADYERFVYPMIWWPMQDYFDLTWERISYSLFNPQARAALWEIAFNRNFEPYARLFNKTTLTPETWSPAHRFSLFIRRDMATRLWEYRVGGADTSPALSARLQAPAAIALLPNGERWVADRRANRIFRLDASGSVRAVFGGPGSQPGRFNEPWGVAVDEEGNIYVADTFNHRVQKFDPQGNFLLSWGRPGATDAPGFGSETLFFGPRAIAFDRQGHVLVTDTGNKRVQVFDREGNFITQFGGAGDAPGKMNEPVGIAVDAAGNIYVADVWNRRVQVFDAAYRFVRAWSVPEWQAMDRASLQSVEHKPYLAVAGGVVYVTSPGTGQVLAFSQTGAPLALPSVSFAPGSAPMGIAARSGVLYVTDSNNARVLEFPLVFDRE